ncbi:hypothetical protein EJ04DRAFT_510274 [Polyplosphaeria fusca]|uniref:GAR domain-containing protein n=1 Tax=Polyplosphaeria fusca TaxID=682080 RepID=A0A9P4V2P0_9PLEO|nr:hypothetical protein EJ04DRAFT_510274 [Polyplosphaeria fusca]
MAGLSSPLRILPPISPYRAPSPTMSPGKRLGRTLGASEDSHLRDLSPDTTLRAFSEKPLPFDTTLDEYKIFACINALTPAERDLGQRVAKAAQRLKSWCDEIAQWGWTGSFDPPSEHIREARRKSLEGRIREYTGDVESVAPLKYCGSLLEVEVADHEHRLDDISEELLTLDIEELKEHVLDIHGGSSSRPSSAGLDASRQNYTPMDDFSFLITQTLLSALPHHHDLKDRLNTWTARVTVLRAAPRFLDDLQTAQKAMRHGWHAMESPEDDSDATLEKWKEAFDTIESVLQGQVSRLGKRLDVMLDTLEGREDCLPEDWIDVFESIEADFGQWAHESRKRMIDFDVRRKTDRRRGEMERQASPDAPPVHSNHGATGSPPQTQPPERNNNNPNVASLEETANGPDPAAEPGASGALRRPSEHASEVITTDGAPGSVDVVADDESVFEEDDTVIHNDFEEEEEDAAEPTPVRQKSTSFSETPVVITPATRSDDVPLIKRPHTPRSRSGSLASIQSDASISSSPPAPVEESPSVRNATHRNAKAPPPALNAAMTKRRTTKKAQDLALDEAPPWPPTQFSKQLLSPNADELDRKISDILTTIPAHIRLTSGRETELRSPRGVATKGSKGYLRAARSISGLKSPELTLSPAKQDFDSANSASGRKSASAMRGDNDIKLYHLTQPGKEHPQKLFIRRVGENGERVMVRVGGGWADLGEYLRDYAIHHGHRTASEGKFEILGLEVKGSEFSPRPESAMSKRDRRWSGGAPRSSPSTTPKKPTGAGVLKDVTPANATSTPGPVDGQDSTPSTGSSRHSWTGNEAGLAGPKSKKIDLNEDKQRWVEGMLKQARTVSGNMANALTPAQHREGADSRSESRAGGRNNDVGDPARTSATRTKKGDFGDLGKVGGTKRVFMKGGG